MEKRLYRIPQEGVIGGVCAGVAKYFAVDPTLVRLLWVILTLCWGAGLILYIIAWIIMPVQSIVAPAPAKRKKITRR